MLYLLIEEIAGPTLGSWLTEHKHSAEARKEIRPALKDALLCAPRVPNTKSLLTVLLENLQGMAYATQTQEVQTLYGVRN